MERLEALQNLAFLMRIDVTKPENLTLYLQYMDRILDGHDRRSRLFSAGQ